MDKVVIEFEKMDVPSRVFKEGLSGDAFGVYARAEPGKQYIIYDNIPALVIIETFESLNGGKQRVFRNTLLQAPKGKTIVIDENSKYLIGCFWGNEIEIGKENYLYNCHIIEY